MRPRLEIDSVSVAFDGVRVVDDVTASIGPGEFVALLGANGSGKSTLTRAAMGLVAVDRGEVRLFGSPLSRFGEWERIGYVPQRTSAVAGVPATVGEVVMSGRLARRRLFGLWGRGDREAVDEALEQVDLADRSQDPVADLSGGQQQRVLIARALATRPELLVLDEPTAGVDHENQVRLAQAFGRLADHGCTIVFVTHEVGPFAPHIDRSLVLRAGRLVHDAPGTVVAGAGREHDHPHSSEPVRDSDLQGEGIWR